MYKQISGYFLLLMLSNSLFAGQPLTIDDTAPVEKGTFESEALFELHRHPLERHMDIPLGITYGLFNNFEIGFGIGGHLNDKIIGINSGETVSGLHDVILGSKWQLYKMNMRKHNSQLSFAIANAVKFPTANADKGLGTGIRDYNFVLLMTFSRSNIDIDFNSGITLLEETSPSNNHTLHYGIAVRKKLNNKINLVGEVFSDNVIDAENVYEFNTGIQYFIKEDLELDVGIGAGLNAHSSDLIFKFGFTNPL